MDYELAHLGVEKGSFVDQYSGLILKAENDHRETLAIWVDRKNDPFSRRLLVRGVVNYVEASISAIRGQILMANDFFSSGIADCRFPSELEDLIISEFNLDLTVKDFAKLSAVSLDFLKGREAYKDLRTCLKDAIKEVTKFHAFTFRHEISLNCRGREFQDFVRLKLARNYLTHPRGSDDFDVPENFGQKAFLVGHWFGEYCNRTAEVALAKFKRVADFKGR